MFKTCIKGCLLMAVVLFCLLFVIVPAKAQEPTYRLGAAVSGVAMVGGAQTGADLYNYLTGYGFSDIALQFNVPPSQPSNWQKWKTFLKDLILTAETDGVYGQKCRIFWILGCHNGLAANEWLGAIHDLLSTIGPNHWAFMGGYLRGEFIYRQVPIPPTLAELKAQWLNVKAKFNAYGYNWGVWAGIGPLADAFPELKEPATLSSFVEGPIVNVCTVSWNPDNTKGTQYTYEDFSIGPLKYPTGIATVALGMWDNQWFVPNTAPYYVTYKKLEAAFKGYSEAYRVDPNKCQTLFWYVMPALFNEALCPYLSWWSQFCATYNVRVYTSPPPVFTPPPPIPAPPYPFPPYPVCQECTVTPTINRGNVGGGVNPIMYPGDTFRVSGRSINLATGVGLANKVINFYVQKPGSLVGELYGSGTTDSTGRFNIQGLVAPSIEGQWYCYTKFEGEESQYLSGESIRETFYIQTTGPPPPPPPPPTTYKLDIGSSPVTDMSFTLDGVGRVTPFSTSLSEGSHTIVMPSTTTIAGTTYNFVRWEDGTNNPLRTINLASDMTLTAYYQVAPPPPPQPPPQFFLAVSSSPIVGVFFTLDASRYKTPYSTTLSEGSHTVTMPSSVIVAGITYNFKSWEDASTSRTRTINLLADMTITAYYEVAPSPPSPPPSSPPPLPPSSSPPANDALNLTNPSIGMRGCLAAKQAYIFQVNVSDPDGAANLNYVDLILDPTGQAIKVRWTESTDAWSEENDLNDYIYLGECWKSISGERVTLNFAIVFKWTYPDENLHSVRLYSLNDNDLSDSDDFTDVYYVENDLVMQIPLVSDDRVDPGQTITVSGNIYYEGTSIHPPDGDYQVKVKLLGTQKGPTNTTLTSGHYTITIPAEPTVGSYTYQVSCNHNASAVDTPSVIVDKLMVSITADSHEVDVRTRVNFILTITRQHDSTKVTSFTIAITRNRTTWLTLTDQTFNDTLLKPGHYTYSTESIKDNAYGLTTFETNNLTIKCRQKIVKKAVVNIATQVKDQTTNTPISGASVHIKNDTWTCETKYTNASGWANFTIVEIGTYTIVGEAKGYATALDTVSVTTDITYTLLVSKRALQLAAMPIMSPDFSLILMAASAFSAFSALSYFVFQRRSKR